MCQQLAEVNQKQKEYWEALPSGGAFAFARFFRAFLDKLSHIARGCARERMDTPRYKWFPIVRHPTRHTVPDLSSLGIMKKILTEHRIPRPTKTGLPPRRAWKLRTRASSAV